MQIETLRLSVKSPTLRVQKKFKSVVVEERSLYTLQTAIYVGGHRFCYAQLLNVISWNRFNQVRLRSRALLPKSLGLIQPLRFLSLHGSQFIQQEREVP